MNRVWQVYSATVLDTGETYVGSADCPFQYRAAEHFNAAFDNQNKSHKRPLQNAIRTYGMHRILIRLVAEVTGPDRTKNMLHATEQIMMNRLDAKSMNKNKAYAKPDLWEVFETGFQLGAIKIFDECDVFSQSLAWFYENKLSTENLRLS